MLALKNKQTEEVAVTLTNFCFGYLVSCQHCTQTMGKNLKARQWMDCEENTRLSRSMGHLAHCQPRLVERNNRIVKENRTKLFQRKRWKSWKVLHSSRQGSIQKEHHIAEGNKQIPIHCMKLCLVCFQGKRWLKEQKIIPMKRSSIFTVQPWKKKTHPPWLLTLMNPALKMTIHHLLKILTYCSTTFNDWSPSGTFRWKPKQTETCHHPWICQWKATML